MKKKKIKDAEVAKQGRIEAERIKEWEIKFDAERKRRDEEQSLMEERLREEEEMRKNKLELDQKNPDKMN